MKDIVIGKLLAHSCGGFVCAMWVSTWWVRARLKSKTIVCSLSDDHMPTMEVDDLTSE